jgi:hypothetical protein
MLQPWKTDAKTHLRPSSVTFGDTFSQREKAFGLHRTKGFSLWEKLAAQRTDEGAVQCTDNSKPMRIRSRARA